MEHHGKDSVGQAHIDGKDKDDAQFDPVLLTDTLRDPMFSASVVMILSINRIPQDLASWGEGCTCHGLVCQRLTVWRQQKMFQNHYGQGVHSNTTCPMRGKRAPELAAGEVESQAYEQVWKAAFATLTQDFLRFARGCLERGPVWPRGVGV